MRLYVGNLPYSMTTDELRAAFAEFGDVTDVHLPTDRETGRPRGFGFVEMADDAQGQAAMEGLAGKEIGGRAITVDRAHERPARPERGQRGGQW